MRRACEDAVKWPPLINIAVNLSPVQFQNPDLASSIASILDESKLSPERLELEITKSVLLSDQSVRLIGFGDAATVTQSDFLL